MKTKVIEICLGIGVNQLFPEYTKIEIPQRSIKEEYEERERLLAEITKFEQDVSIYDDPTHNTYYI